MAQASSFLPFYCLKILIIPVIGDTKLEFVLGQFLWDLGLWACPCGDFQDYIYSCPDADPGLQSHFSVNLNPASCFCPLYKGYWLQQAKGSFKR